MHFNSFNLVHQSFKVAFYKIYFNMIRKYQNIVLLFLVLFANKLNAQNLSVSNSPAVKQTDFSLVSNNSVAAIAISDEDYMAVKLAANFFAEDVKRVSGRLPKIINNISVPVPQIVIAGTLGKSAIIDKLVATGKITNINKIKGHWEASLWQVVNNPAPGVKKALVIIGSDRRGTAYGLMQLSKKIGVSPWYWWADVPVIQRKMMTISIPVAMWDEPAVKYRGIFINDEDWGINEWARKNFETGFGNGVGPKTYEKVFELMMRLRLNYLWPAMHEVSKEFGDTPENVELADRYGIVAGSSHCEPMLYNNVHWNEKLRGNWNYSLNRDTIYNVWKQTALARGSKEAVWTMGIRGIHDRGMETPPTTIPDRINLLEQVFTDQRDLINEHVSKEWGPVAQCFVPYKEVLPVYDAGLKVPDDVTLVWVDDNFGYIRRLSNPTERNRSGGSGLYWHLSYYGSPHSYTWLNSTSPALMWEEFDKAWENQTRTMWVINVGDIKPMELGIDYFSRLAWNPEAQGPDAQPKFLKAFLGEHFETEMVAPLTQLLNAYYHLGTVRKPELMNRTWALSLSDKNADQLKTEYENLRKIESSVAAKIASSKQEAYNEMIGIPARIMSATALIFMHDRAIVFGSDSMTHKAEIDRLKTFLEKQVENYNNIAGGKWKYMMPGTVTGKYLLAWNSQVAWPWGETAKPDTSKKASYPYLIKNASSASRQTNSKGAKWTQVPGLGTSGQAMALKPVRLAATWDSTDVSAPTLEYNFATNGKGVKVQIDFLPSFRIYPGMQLRVAVGIDNKFIKTVEVPGSSGKEDENGPNRNQGIRNNYVRATIDLPGLNAGSHRLFIRAMDPGAVIDKISFFTE